MRLSKFCLIFIICFILFPMPHSFAEDIPIPIESKHVPECVVTNIRYRIWNGKVQCRDWDITNHRWASSCWKTIQILSPKPSKKTAKKSAKKTTTKKKSKKATQKGSKKSSKKKQKKL